MHLCSIFISRSKTILQHFLNPRTAIYNNGQNKQYLRKSATVFPINYMTERYFDTIVMMQVVEQTTSLLKDIGTMMYALVTP